VLRCTRPLVGHDSPLGRYEWHRKYDQACYGQQRDDQGDAEVNEDLGDFLEEVTAINFLLHHAPFCQELVSERVLVYGKDSQML
jgi:hypothetical protein